MQLIKLWISCRHQMVGWKVSNVEMAWENYRWKAKNYQTIRVPQMNSRRCSRKKLFPKKLMQTTFIMQTSPGCIINFFWIIHSLHAQKRQYRGWKIRRTDSPLYFVLMPPELVGFLFLSLANQQSHTACAIAFLKKRNSKWTTWTLLEYLIRLRTVHG